MDKYKSWSDLNKRLTDNLCEKLKSRVTYFLTRYHEVHNAYGRASIRVDGKEVITFSWIDEYRQESDVGEYYQSNPKSFEKMTDNYRMATDTLKDKWDINCTYGENDFLNAALKYRSMSIADALESTDYIIRIFAILDQRVGKRTLEKIENEQKYLQYPDWVKKFYSLRLTGTI